MGNNIKQVRDILFEQLQRLNDEDLTAEDLDKEAHRTGQMVMIGNTLVDSARAETEFLRLTQDLAKGTGFLEAEEDFKYLPDGEKKTERPPATKL